MRIVFIIILVLLGIVLALPYFFGINTEKKYNELVELSAQNQNISVVESEYERGWLKSKAKTIFSVIDQGKEVARIANGSDIYHGPVPFARLANGGMPFAPVLGVIDSKAVIAAAPGSEYENIITGLPPVIANIVINLDSGGTGEIIVPGIESILEEDDEIFSWSGLTANIKFKPNFSDINTELSSAGMAINSKELEFSLKSLTGNSNLQYKGGDYSIPLGDVEFNIESLDILNKEGESGEFEMSVKNLVFDGSTEDFAGVLNFTHTLGFNELSLDELKYGTGGYKFALRNIDKTAWKEIQEILQRASQKTNDEDAEIQNQEMAEIMAVLPEIVSKSPELEISDLILETGDGDLKGNLFIAINGGGLEDPEMALNPMFLLAALTANAELSVSQKLLEDALLGFNVEEIQDEISKGEMEELSESEVQSLAAERTKQDIEQFTSENTLVLEDGRYVLKAEYSAGQVNINSNPIGLDKLLGQ